VAKDTCKWLLEDVHYQAWMNKPQGLFWIKGDPGAGKSVLMKHAISNMREHDLEDLLAVFFFHGQGTDLQKAPLGLFRALLNILLPNFPEYLTQLATTFQEREVLHGAYTEGRWKWTEKELEHVLYNVLTKGTQHRPAVIFVDALDECGEKSAKSLFAYFKHVTAQAERDNGRIKVCLSSRHHPILDLQIVPVVHVEKRNGKDIRRYTQERLKDFRPKLKRKQIESEILSRAGGGFQWVFLVTETIIDKKLRGITAETLLRELTTCPETLGELYASILRDVPAAEHCQMVKIFQWVLYAQRPLSAQELRDALGTDKDMSCKSIRDLRAHEGWSDTIEDFERYVKHISRGLIHFQSRDLWEQYILHGEDSDREAQLIHQSVADYLSDRFLHKVEHELGNFPSPAGAGHFQISRSCLRYLTVDEILEDPRPSRGTLSSMFPLAPYAVRFVFDHIQCVEQEGISQSDLLFALQWTPKSAQMRKLAITWSALDPQRAHTPLGWPFVDATSMHVLVAFGSRSAVDLYLETNSDRVDERDPEGHTPLMLAIREGHQDIALALLDWSTRIECQTNKDNNKIHGGGRSKGHSVNHVMDVNAKNKDGDSVLDIALDQKAEDVIVKLIEAGADLKYLGRESALVFFAISSRNMKLLSMCIEKKLNLDGSVAFALRGHPPQQDHIFEDIISKLLKAGANTARATSFDSISEPEDYGEDEIDTGESYDDDALMMASRRGLVSIVNLLLTHGSSATSANEIGEIPLLVATKNGHVETVQSLLRKEPSSVNIEDDEGRTALEIAIENAHEAVVKLLLDTGKVDINAATSGRSTPLLLAAEKGHEAIVKLLLNTGMVDVNAVRSDRSTPLLLAAENGYKAVVQLLLDTGKVDVNVKTTDGSTPLFLAAQKGHKAVVKLLLDTGRVDVNAARSNGSTPLLWAAQKGHEAVVKLLLDTGKVVINAATPGGSTPLLLAAENGHEAVVKLLLDTEMVDVDAKTTYGWTPLLRATQNSHKAVVKLLLDTGKVDVNAKTTDGWTPLLRATSKGHKVVAKLLLDTGKVDLNAVTSDTSTSLLQTI
jgi:ankyrin repeat protein